MTENQIGEKTAAHTRAALLALAAESGKDAGECLTPAMMASFLDNSCSPEEKDQALRHISLCRRCYGEWLFLAQMQLERGKKHRKKEVRPYFLRPLNLAAIGSAMAAMICIAVFLDIAPFKYRPGREVAPPVVTSQQDAATAPVATKQPAVKVASPASSRRQEQPTPPQKKATGENQAGKSEGLGKGSFEQASAKLKSPATIVPLDSQPAAEMETSVPVPAVPTVSQSAAETKSDAPAPVAPVISQPATAPPPAADAEQKAGSAAPQEMLEEAGVQRQAIAPLSFQQWSEELIAVCRDNDRQQADQVRLRRLFHRGKSALPTWRQEPAAESAELSLQAMLVPLLEQARSEAQLIDHCREILTAAEKKSD